MSDAEIIIKKLEDIESAISRPQTTLMLTTLEAAEYCKCCKRTIDEHSEGGLISFSQPSGARGKRYYHPDDLEIYLNKNKTEAFVLNK